ncbi:uncharacterized protein METZ01_LOCUS144905 [marine metagenome]|uniref:Uncharacterized protein n=1 Tax=marine metagenome TaxID=408172 RepID=A0A381ZSW6_9ZZZZ
MLKSNMMKLWNYFHWNELRIFT